MAQGIRILKLRDGLFKTNALRLSLLRLAFWCAGLSLMVWACLDRQFRDAENSLTGEFCLPVSAGVALFVLGGAITGPLKTFAGWFALLIVGQAVALQLIDAGPSMHYQHYRPIITLARQQPLLLACFLAQSLVVVAAGVRHLGPAYTWLGRNFTWWQLMGIAAIFSCTAATVSADVWAYVGELGFAITVQVINLATLLLAARALPPTLIEQLKRHIKGASEKIFTVGIRRTIRIDVLAACAALWVILLASALSFFVYQRHPHVPDEASYVVQAKYFAAGMLTMPAPAIQGAFDMDLMTYEKDRWYSPFPPGWPAMLALGVLLRAAWLINPILGGLNVLAVFALFKELYDRRAARCALLLLATSPWYVFMAMNYMAHTFTLTCALVATLALIRARHTNQFWWAALSGLAVGATSLIRPLDGFILGLLLGMWAVGGRRLKLLPLCGFAGGALPGAAANLAYNKIITGSFTRFPVNVFFDKYYGAGSNAMGFGPERGMGWALDAYPGHSLFEALVNANLNFSSINFELFGWGTGALLLCALALVSGRLKTSDRLMVVVVLVVVAMYSLYWFSGGPDFGARYWYLAIIPCVALTVSGLREAERRLDGSSFGKNRVAAALALLCFCALVNYFPWRAVDKYHHYLGMRPDVRALAGRHDFANSVVLIRGERYPDYASAAVYNSPDGRGAAPVFIWDRDSEVRDEALRVYAERTVWVVNGPSLTGRGFEVVQGPLSANNLLSAGGVTNLGHTPPCPLKEKL